jgi:general secretion pathway protein C
VVQASSHRVAATPSAAHKPGERIAGWQLFGAPPAAVPQAPAPVEAPETKLNLILRGLLHSADPQLARAIIAAGADEAQYGVGARLPGNAELAAIHADRVILLHRGRHETLRLPRDKLDATVATAPGTPASPPVRAERMDLAQLRESALRDPTKLGEIIRVDPALEDGDLIGYRVGPGPNRQAFDQLGLRAGDVVIALNGVVLDDAGKALDALNKLRDADQVSLTLLRDGSEEELTLRVR